MIWSFSTLRKRRPYPFRSRPKTGCRLLPALASQETNWSVHLPACAKAGSAVRLGLGRHPPCSGDRPTVRRRAIRRAGGGFPTHKALSARCRPPTAISAVAVAGSHDRAAWEWAGSATPRDIPGNPQSAKDRLRRRGRAMTSRSASAQLNRLFDKVHVANAANTALPAGSRLSRLQPCIRAFPARRPIWPALALALPTTAQEPMPGRDLIAARSARPRPASAAAPNARAGRCSRAFQRPSDAGAGCGRQSPGARLAPARPCLRAGLPLLWRSATGKPCHEP